MPDIEDKVAALHFTVDQLTANQRNVIELLKRARKRELETNKVLDATIDLIADQSKAIAALTVTVATLAVKLIDHIKTGDEDEGRRGD